MEPRIFNTQSKHFEVVGGVTLHTVIRNAASAGANDAVNYIGMAPVDVRNEIVFRLKLDGRDAGFATVYKRGFDHERQLAKIYVPHCLRGKGIARNFLRGANIAKFSCPVKARELFKTASALGFVPADRQPHPNSVIDMVRRRAF